MSSHIVIQSGFRHKQYQVWAIMIAPFCFRHRPHLYNHVVVMFDHHNRSHPHLIGPNSSLSVLTYTKPKRSIMLLSYMFFSYHKSDLIRLIIAALFCFRYRPHLYYQSRSWSIWFSSQFAPSLIGHNSLVSFSM